MSIKSHASSDAPQLQTLSRENFWQRHVAQWRESGLSKMAYCQQYSLVYHQMVYWCTKASKTDELGNRSLNNFVSVAVTPGVNCAPDLSVRLPNGIVIEGIDESNVSLVGKLVDQL